MNVLIVCAIIAITLFSVVFISKRKFGLLGFALAVGSILSKLWVDRADYFLGMLNAPSGALAIAMVSSAIILTPPVLLIFHDGKYKSLAGSLIGSVLFALLALAMIVEPLGRVLVLQGASATIYNTLLINSDAIIAVCLILSIIDLLMPKYKHSNEKHHNH